jgi:excisionase family DNA binding protein
LAAEIPEKTRLTRRPVVVTVAVLAHAMALQEAPMLDKIGEVNGDLIHRSVKLWAPVLGLSEKTLREAVRAGRLGHVRIGDRVLIGRKHIEAWLAANERL